LIICSLLVRCGSSVYVQKKSRYLVSMASCSPVDMLWSLPLATASFLLGAEVVTVVAEGAILTDGSILVCGAVRIDVENEE